MSLPGKKSKTACFIALVSQFYNNEGQLLDFPSFTIPEEDHTVYVVCNHSHR